MTPPVMAHGAHRAIPRTDAPRAIPLQGLSVRDRLPPAQNTQTDLDQRPPQPPLAVSPHFRSAPTHSTGSRHRLTPCLLCSMIRVHLYSITSRHAQDSE